jgi:hypothetical protein
VALEDRRLPRLVQLPGQRFFQRRWKKVTSRKQAIGIGLSEACRAGGQVPKKNV